MSRALRTSMALAALLGTASPVSAQDACMETFTASLVRVDGPGDLGRSGDKINLPLGAAHCAAKDQVSLVIRYENAPSAAFLDTWRGASGEDCSKEARRGGNGPLCVDLTNTDISDPGTTDDEVVLSLADVLAFDEAKGERDPCADQGSTQWLYLLASSSTATTGPVTGYGCVEIVLDLDKPTAPTVSSSDLSGSSSVPLRWEAQGEGTGIDHYEIYVDDTAESCADSTLDTNLGVGRKVETAAQTATSQDLDMDILNVPLGGERAVVIVAVDTAQNEGDPSSIACVRRVETVGFCDAYEAETGEPCSSECGVVRVGAGGGLAGLLGLGIAFVGLLLRRRRLA